MVRYLSEKSSEVHPELAIAKLNVHLTSPDGIGPPDTPPWTAEVDHPYLHGVFAPTTKLVSSDELEVVGEIPRDLFGAYVRNGPNQRFSPCNKYHYYDGDGLLAAIQFEGGRARFKSAWVRTREFHVEDKAGCNIWPGLAGPYDFNLPESPLKDTSNTDVIFYNGKLLTLWYLAGVPYRFDPLTLEPMGAEDFGGKLRSTLSAHTSVCPDTGQLIFFNYGPNPPYMTYGVADAQGQLIREIDVDLPGPRSPHDIGVTPNYSILHDLPFFQDAELYKTKGLRVVRFHPELPARFGVVPRFGGNDDIQWFECEPCYILHIVNCWEEGDWVIQEGCRQPNPDYVRDPRDGPLASMLAQRRRVHQYYRWMFNLKTGAVKEYEIDGMNTEFPTVNTNYYGHKTRYSYHQHIPLPEPDGGVEGRCQLFKSLVKFDTETGAKDIWDYGDGVYGSEAPAPAKKGLAYGDGEEKAHVVTFTTDENTWASECLIFEAADIAQGPVARVKIPMRLPIGFHSTWIPGEAIF